LYKLFQTLIGKVLLELKPIVAEEVYVDIFPIDNVVILPVLDKVGLLLIITDPTIDFSRTTSDFDSCAIHTFGTRG